MACATTTPPRLLAPLRVYGVEQQDEEDGGGYLVRARWGPAVEQSGGEYREPVQSIATSAEGVEVSLCTPQPPLLCVGFEGSAALGVVKDLFEWGGKEDEKNGSSEGDSEDESDKRCLTLCPVTFQTSAANGCITVMSLCQTSAVNTALIN